MTTSAEGPSASEIESCAAKWVSVFLHSPESALLDDCIMNANASVGYHSWNDDLWAYYALATYAALGGE